ncbi:MAG TPA: protein kinase [Pyrinomonadaceae bacterium]|nr:protein kinase [Pyrinomonadaceae bacterium]
MDFADLVGQILDDKYRIERQLGRGGMGTVYLATHLGTERPVAVKVIAPQFMERAEFVERFRREARAAGRLRHPNVVDVTDFGFSDTSDGRVAYLVMEYLDGCTLGEILEEEKSLPLNWTLNILEEVCSAVQEAHEQGIIHRDLKPDNIWLEPNQRGGHTVKVLDFGIAKLEEAVAHESADTGATFAELRGYTARPTFASSEDGTIAIDRPLTIGGDGPTIAQGHDGNTAIAEAATIAESNPAFTESQTAIMAPPVKIDQESAGTRLVSEVDTNRSKDHPVSTDLAAMGAVSTGELTRVGAVLGTPLYMSPEQCRGEKLDPRSDVYSLGVIAYQMLSGGTPFSGDFADVMRAHKELPPPPILKKGIRKKLKRTIYKALEKDPAGRPQSAESFAGVLRSQSEGLFVLLRRALVIYSEHLQKFLGLSTALLAPVIALTVILVTVSFLRVSGTISSLLSGILLGTTGLLQFLVGSLCAFLLFGTVSWIVAQYLAVPLRPIRLRPAANEARKKWKSFAWTAILGTIAATIGVAAGAIVGMLISALVWFTATRMWGLNSHYLVIVGTVICAITGLCGFLGVHALFSLVSAVVMMEGRHGIAALRRSVELARRSFRTALGAVLITFIIPAVAAFGINYIVKVSAKAYFPTTEAVAAQNKADDADDDSAKNTDPKEVGGLKVSVGKSNLDINTGEHDMGSRVRDTIQELLVQILWLPMQIVVSSFSAILIALLYLKTRQAGGECTHEFLAKFEEAEPSRRKWQERVRQRLIQSGRITSKPT